MFVSVCAAFTGVLCGVCNNTSAVSVLLNRCVTCGNTYAFLLPLLGEIIFAENYEVYKNLQYMNVCVAETSILKSILITRFKLNTLVQSL